MAWQGSVDEARDEAALRVWNLALILESAKRNTSKLSELGNLAPEKLAMHGP